MISFGIGLLAEIPSGVLADRIGRKRLVIAGAVMGACGLAVQGLVNSYTLILLGQAVATAGWAFQSGAEDALFYDALNYDSQSNAWKKLVSKGNQIEVITTLITYVIGGLLYIVSPRLPFIACIITAFSVVPLLKIKELKRLTHNQSQTYFKDIKDGFLQLTKKGIRGYLPIIFIVQGIFYAFSYGLLRPILQTRFGFGATDGGIMLFITGLTAFILQRLQLRYVDRFSEKKSIAFICVVVAAALFAAVFPLGTIGAVVIAVIYAAEYLIQPILSDGLNKHVDSAHRATALSSASFLQALPYVLLASLIGYLNTHGKLSYYLLSMSVLTLLAVLIYLRSIKATGRLELSEALIEPRADRN